MQVSSAQEADSAGLARLEWLTGKWERQNMRPGRTAFEKWEKKDWGYTGVGISLQGADTVFVERLSIRLRDGDLWYVADVSQNAEPTWFKFTEISLNGFACENPDHDFPKKIEYVREEPGSMKVVLSGDGKSASFTFRMLSEDE